MVGVPVDEHFLPFHSDRFEASEKFRASQNLASLVSSYKNGKFADTSRGVISGLSGLIRAIRNDDGNATVEDYNGLEEKGEILHMRWKSRHTVTVVISDGTIAHLTLKNLTTQETSVHIDKSLRQNDVIAGVAYAHKVVVFLFEDNRLLVARTFEVEAQGAGDLVQPEFTINVYPDFLPQLATRKVCKTVSISDDRNYFVIWWPASKDDVFPWSPKPEDRANILIYRFHPQEMPELMSFLRTEYKLLDAAFVPNNNEFSTLEREVDSDGTIAMVEIFYELFSMTRLTETAIPLQSEFTCYAYDSERKRLAIGCCDSSVVIYSRCGQITLYTKAPFIPRMVSWHPDSYLLFVADDNGRYQLFDIALNPILLVSATESVPSFIRESVHCGPLQRLLWSPWPTVSGDSNLLIQFETGCMIILRFVFCRMGLLELVRFYLDNYETCEAIKVLRSIYWDSDECLQAMYLIFGELIKCEHSEKVESELESLLVIYFKPTYGGDDGVRKKHSKSLRVLARRYFMWLLPVGKLQRAAQVAASLDEAGLFDKLHHVAKSQGNEEVATSALESLRPLLSSSSGSSGSGSEESYSTCTSHSEDCSSCESSAGSSREGSTDDESSPEDDAGQGEASHHVLVPEVSSLASQVGSLRVLPLEEELPSNSHYRREQARDANGGKQESAKPSSSDLPIAALRVLSANKRRQSPGAGGAADLSDIQVVNLGAV